jgi:acyl carrier protein
MAGTGASRRPAVLTVRLGDGMPGTTARVKEMIVRVLMLEGVTPDDLDDEEVLFGAGRRLDSVDALEVAIHIEEEFGVKIPDDEVSRRAFRSVSSLVAYIDAHR